MSIVSAPVLLFTPEPDTPIGQAHRPLANRSAPSGLMVGSVAIGFWIAHGVFWLLMVWAFSERRTRLATVFIGQWLIGYAGSGWVSQGAPLFASYVALLDVALVLALFRGDVRLT